jgi:hypothetical protein
MNSKQLQKGKKYSAPTCIEIGNVVDKTLGRLHFFRIDFVLNGFF